MTRSERELVDAIESTLFVYPAVPGLTEDLGVPGLRGRVTKLSHPIANLCGDARFGTMEADAKVAKVRERYGSRAFGWVTGPSTRPTDLADRLGAAGFRRIADLAGLALTDLDERIDANPDVRVREVALAEAIDASEWMGRAYDLPTDVTRLFNEMLARSRDHVRARGYFAYRGGDRPVAWSYLVYVPGTRIALLGGAATLAEHRGHGVYTALVARRLADARADGLTAAIIQADRATSAPICAKLGFREVCALELFAAGED
jgi:GNAT superfamily N-acetyltransferase